MSFLKIIIYNLIKIYSSLYSYSFNRYLQIKWNLIYSIWVSFEFKKFGEKSMINSQLILIGGKYISIGDNTNIGVRSVLTAWDQYNNIPFQPEIIIGSNVSIGDDSHITAINKIVIGNNVLTGKKITITDNSHGKSLLELFDIAPSQRNLYSEGPVYIEDGVWIGDKVTILPNVRIGKNSIIGANAVVTKDIPSNCVAAGNPARIIKIINN